MSEKERQSILSLAASAKAGDRDAYEPLYRKTVAGIRGICARYFQHSYDIDDAVQEVYIKIFRGLPSLESSDAFFTWSRTLAKNTCLNMIRSRNLISSREFLPNVSDEENTDSAAADDRTAAEYRTEWNPEAAAEMEMKAQILQDILASISDAQRSCILLWAEGYTYKAIAQRLGMPAGTTKSTVYYAKKRITERILQMEKEQGIRLHGMAPLPFFLWLLEQDSSDGAGTPSAAASPEAAPELTAPLAGKLTAGAGAPKANSMSAVIAAGVMLLALLLPVGIILASNYETRTAPFDEKLASDPVRSFHISPLSSGGRASVSVREEGIGADPSAGSELQPEQTGAEASLPLPQKESGTERAVYGPETFSDILHNREGLHPEEEAGAIEHREADQAFSPDPDAGTDQTASETPRPEPEADTAPAAEHTTELLTVPPDTRPLSAEALLTPSADATQMTAPVYVQQPAEASVSAAPSQSGPSSGEQSASTTPDSAASASAAVSETPTPSADTNSGTPRTNPASEGSPDSEGRNTETNPAAEPVSTPTPEPTAAPTPSPTPEPTPEPTPTPTPTPEPTPTNIPIQSFRYLYPNSQRNGWMDIIVWNAFEPTQILYEALPANMTEEITWTSGPGLPITITPDGVATYSPTEVPTDFTLTGVLATTPSHPDNLTPRSLCISCL